LPGSPSAGTSVRICDVGGACSMNPLSVAGNGNNIANSSSNFIIDVNWSNITLIYFSGNWAPVR